MMISSNKACSHSNKSLPSKSSRKFRRNRNRNRRRRNLTSESKIINSILNSQLQNLNNSTPTILFELSSREWSRLKDNSIIVSGSGIVNSSSTSSTRHNNVFYSSIVFGSNIQSDSNVSNLFDYNINLSRRNGGNLLTRQININAIPNRLLLIVTPRLEIQNINQNNIIVSSSFSTTNGPCTNPSSGMVVLLLLRSSNINNSDMFQWSIDSFQQLKHVKKNIIKNIDCDNHFGSQGFIASYGNRGAYKMTSKTSSISQYVSKKTVDPNVLFKSLHFEYHCKIHLDFAIKSFQKIIPNVKKLICPILNSAHQFQKEVGDINFREVQSSNLGLWQSSICVNAMTRIFHTEKDVTYTIISVPKQNLVCSDMKRKSTFFLFRLNNSNCLSIKMNPGISFLFSGTMLTHRQCCVDGYRENDIPTHGNIFFNIASYGNEKLFCHLRKSFERIIHIDK